MSWLLQEYAEKHMSLPFDKVSNNDLMKSPPAKGSVKSPRLSGIMSEGARRVSYN